MLNKYIFFAAIVLGCVNTILMIDVNVINKYEEPYHVSFLELGAFLEFFVSGIVSHHAFPYVNMEQLRNSSFYKYNNNFLRRIVKSLDVDGLKEEDVKLKLAILINIRNLLMLDSVLWRETTLKNITDLKIHEESHSYLIQDGDAVSIKDFNTIIFKEYETEADQEIMDYISIMTVLYYPFQGLPKLKAIKSEEIALQLRESTMDLCSTSIMPEKKEIYPGYYKTSVVLDYFFSWLKQYANWEDAVMFRWMSRCVTDKHLKTLLFYQSLEGQYLDMIQVGYNETILTGEIMERGRNKLEVELYLQSFCPNTRHFIMTQLNPVWHRIKTFVDMEIIPFGVAKVAPINNGESFEFECQYGSEECEGNKLLSCAVEMLPTQLQISFINCWFEIGPLADTKSRNSKSEETGDKCSEMLNIPVAPLKLCLTTLTGDELLYKNGFKTFNLRPKLEKVPAIRMNNTRSAELDKDSFTLDFLNSICKAYLSTDNPNGDISTPLACKTVIEISLDFENENLKRFFFDQLQPTWERLNKIIILKLSPSINSSIQCVNGKISCNLLLECMTNHLSLVEIFPILSCIIDGEFSTTMHKCLEHIERSVWLKIRRCAKIQNLDKSITNDHSKRTSIMVKINGVHSDGVDQLARKDLTKLICNSFVEVNDKYQVSLPEGCPIPVTVYMESLCPDTHNFFIRQLLPAWHSIGYLLDLTIVPYGKANVWLDDETDTYKFECQHGPNECHGNIVMSCVIEHVAKEKHIQFIICMIHDHSTAFAGDRCAKELSVDYEIISNCTNSKEGPRLLYENGLKTMHLQPTLSFVPTITINGFYNKKQLQTSLQSFRSQICHRYQGNPHIGQVLTPNGCKSSVNLYFELPSVQSSRLFMQDIPHVMNILKDHMSIHLYVISTKNKTSVVDGGEETESFNDVCDEEIVAACSLYHIREKLHLKFINCFLKESGTSACIRGKDCSIRLHILWEPIHKCIKMSEFSAILENSEKKFMVDSKSPAQLPMITVNENEVKNEKLLQKICDTFVDPRNSIKKWKPYGCPVSVDLYIEAFCPAAKRFILRQLIPSWTDIRSIVDLNIIAYGKTKTNVINGEKYFDCPNGHSECEANKVLSCVSKILDKDKNKISLIGCLFHKGFNPDEQLKCARNFAIDWTIMEECLSTKGDELLYQNGLITDQLKPKLFYVPTVTINKFYNKEKLKNSLLDFKGEICNAFLENKQDQHSSIVDGCKVKIYVLFDSFNDRMKELFTFVLDSYWLTFNKISRLIFVPLIGFKELQKSNLKTISCLQKDQLCHHSLLLSCIGDIYGVSIQLEFISCLMSHHELFAAYGMCVQTSEVNVAQVERCASMNGSLESIEKNARKFSHQVRKTKEFPLVGVEKEILSTPLHLKRLEEKTCSAFKGKHHRLCTDGK